MGLVALHGALLEREQRGGFPIQGRAHFLLHRHRSGGMVGAALFVQQGCPYILRGANIGRDGIQAGDNGFLLLGALLAFAQPQWRVGRRRLHQRDTLPIGLNDQDAAQWQWRGRGRWLLIEGTDINGGACRDCFQRLHAHRQPEDSFQGGLVFAIGGIGAAITGPVAQQVGIAVVGQTQGRVERTAAFVAGRREIVARHTQLAENRIVTDRPLVVIRPHCAISGGRCRWAFGRLRHEEQAQQRSADGEQAAKQREFDRIGRLGLGLRPGHVGDQCVEIALDLLYNRGGVGRHSHTPVGQSMVGATDYPADGRDVQRHCGARPLLPNGSNRVPHVLVTLK